MPNYKSVIDAKKRRELADGSLKSTKKRSRSRTDAQRKLDMILCAKMYARGCYQSEIVEAINSTRPYTVSMSTVGRDLGIIKNEWLKSALVDFDAARSKELAKLDELERAYWQAWEDSRKRKEVSHAETTNDKTGKEQTTTYARSKLKKVIEDRDGDPVYLQGVERCVEKRCRLLGLFAPEKHEINWRKEAEQVGVDPDQLHESLVKQFLEAAKKGANADQLP